MKIRKIPMRTCVVTREKCEKKDLLRVVRTPLGEVLYDSTGKLNGKGAYLKKSIEVKNAFAHIRYATIGNVEFKNCHPYSDEDNTGRRWTLIHNGTIFEYKPLNAYVKEQSGDTDSERILIHIINLLAKILLL